LIASAARVELVGVSLTSRLVWVSATLYGDGVRRRCDHAVPPSAIGNARPAVPPSAAAERSRRRIKLPCSLGFAQLPGSLVPPGGTTPRTPRSGLSPARRGVGSLNLLRLLRCLGFPDPMLPAPQTSRAPPTPPAPRRGPLRLLGRPDGLSGAIDVSVGRWGRVFGVLGVSVGRWGRYATRRALNDAEGPGCLNQSCPRETCCRPPGALVAWDARWPRSTPRLAYNVGLLLCTYVGSRLRGAGVWTEFTGESASAGGGGQAG